MPDGYFLNKCAGALLFALLVTFALKELSHTLFAAHTPDEPAYRVATDDSDDHTITAAIPTVAPLPQRLALADPGKGRSIAKKCVACHSFEKDGKNKIGPHLWDIIGRKIASIADFSYSSGLIAKNQAGEIWSYAALDAFLDNPKQNVPGTKMSFRGIRDTAQRADLLAWLREQGDDRVPFPSQ